MKLYLCKLLRTRLGCHEQQQQQRQQQSWQKARESILGALCFYKGKLHTTNNMNSTLRSIHNGRYLAGQIFVYKNRVLNQNSTNFATESSISNEPALIPMMARRQTEDKTSAVSVMMDQFTGTYSRYPAPTRHIISLNFSSRLSTMI